MIPLNKAATGIGAVGAALALGHVVLGPDIVPVAVAFLGVILVAAAGLLAVIVRRRSRAGDGQV